MVCFAKHTLSQKQFRPAGPEAQTRPTIFLKKNWARCSLVVRAGLDLAGQPGHLPKLVT